MIKRSLLLVFVCLCLGLTKAQTYTIALQPSTPGYDALLKSANGTTNYGTDTKIRASRNTTSQYERTLLKYDLGGIPANASVVTASLILYGSSQTTSVSNAAYLQIVLGTWDEGTITWNTATGISNGTGQLSLAASAGATDSYTLNVASALQAMINTQATNFGWQLLMQTESNVNNSQMEFYSSDDATAANHPKLIVTYELPLDVRAYISPSYSTNTTDGAINLSVSGGTPPFTYTWSNSANTKDISGLAPGLYTVTMTDANNFQAKKIIPVTTANGTNGSFTITSDALSFKDTKVQTATLNSNVANTNYATTTTNQVQIQNLGSGWNTSRALEAFDLNAIPSNAVITTATLKLTIYAVNETLPLYLTPVTQTWYENTVTWNNQPSTDNASSISFSVMSGTTVYTLDVASPVQKMVQQGTSLIGWQIRLQSEATGTNHLVNFKSADGTSGRPEISLTYTVPSTNYDKDYNWTKTEVYDDNGNIISSSKAYTDGLGRTTQNLSKNALNEVFTSQTVYDQYGRPALNTLPAFTGNTLLYQQNFFKNSSAVLYSYTDYDTTTTLNNPNTAQTSSVNSLGYYYSTNNAYDAYQATATLPYSRVEFTGDPLGGTRRAAKPGNQFKMGSGRENWNFNIVSGTELKGIFGNNNSYKVKMGTSAPLTSTAIAMSSNIIATKNISFGPDRKEMISYVVGGKVVATCMSGLTTDNCSITGVQSFMSYYGTQSRDIHLPDANKTSLILPLPTYTVSSTSYTAASSDMTYSITDLYTDKILVANTDYTLNTSTRAVTFSTGFLNLYPSRGLMLRFSFAFGLTMSNFISNNGGTFPDVEINYSVDYGKWSINYYDLAGHIRKEVSPKGINCSSPGTITMASNYDYSHLGQLISKNTPDEGLVEMNYDSEGKLRYSQNAVQNTGGRFSYINYDARARAVESGEYTTSTTTGTANVFFQNYYLAYTAPNSGNVGTNVGIDNLDALSLVNQCTDTYSTMYEAPTGTVDIPSAFTYSAQYMGKYLNGAVCKTWNANTSTWYNYDAMGRNTAIVKQILDATYTGLKTNVNDQMKVSETVYNNFTSTVNKNIFQLNVSAEKMEVIPVYDALLRPYQTYLNSPARSGLKLSEISYDKMGRSIRNVIGNNLQGVDMVYTLGGKLKAINHPGLYNVFDRGGDNGDYTGGIPSIVNGDLFGEILEYHYNDYEAANTYSVNSISSGSSIYDGLLHSQRFKTRNSVNGTITGASDINYGGPDQLEVVSATSYQQNELMFTYSYDQYKQLGTSAFNTYNNNTNSISARTEYNETGYRGSNISYDANGNINRLIRSAYIVSGGLVNYDDLTYTISSTANNVTGILDAGTLQSATNFSTASTTVGSSLTINSIGQLTGSSPEGVSIIDYYPNGKPKKITFTNNNYTQYFYDDGGNKYKVLFRDSSSHKKKVTWYVGPGLYVLDESISTTSINLNEMNTPAGELKLNGSAYDVIYQLNDHLGNVRVTFKESGVGNGINVLSFADYYAWGGVLPGRNWSSAAYRYGYQSKEIPKDGSNWDQFELRLYNHDLGRWFAPDPYGQFHSPYVAMANNPVSAVDPNGGFTNFAPDPGHIFANKALMDLQRAYQIGNWSQKFLTKKYREAYDDIVKRYNVGTQGGSYGNVAGFLDALRITNNQFQGLGLSNSVLENGTGTLNMDAKVNYQNSIVALNSSIGTDQFQQARMGSDGGRQYSNSITGDDVIMSTCNGYDMQDQEAKAVMGSDYVQREAIQEGGLLRLQDKVGDAISGVGDGVGSNDGTPKLPGVLLDAGTTLETFVTIIANSSKQAQCPGWTEIAGFGLEDENGNTRYYLSSTEGNTEISSNNDVNEVRDAGFKILFELHSHGMGFPSQRDYNLQVGQGFSVHSVDMDGRIWSTSEYNAKYNAFGFPSGVGNADYPNSIFQQYLPLPLKR